MLYPLRSGRPPGARAAVAVVAVVVGAFAVGTVATFLLAPLNGNLRYEAGVKVVSTHSAAATFSHRPLAFRLVMDAVFRVADSFGLGMAGFEFTVRLLLGMLAAGAGVLVWRGLRRRRVPAAGWYAVVLVGALLLLGPVSAGEPDWMAVLLAAAGAGAALLGDRRPWPYVVLAGVLLVSAAGMKIISLPVALLAVVVVGLLDRRQAVRTLLASTAVGLLYLLATLIWVPWEVQWLLDIRTVQNGARAGLPEAPGFFLSLAADRPVLVLVPVALVLAGRRERVVVVGATAVCVGMVLGQGQYFDYHAIPLVVVAAVAVFRGLAAAADRTLGARPVSLLLATATTLALLCPGATPWASHLLRATDTRSRDQVVAGQVHALIGGPQVPVTYLTFGEWTYFLRNPTSCRYPSPLFLQRTRSRPGWTPPAIGRTSSV